MTKLINKIFSQLILWRHGWKKRVYYRDPIRGDFYTLENAIKLYEERIFIKGRDDTAGRGLIYKTIEEIANDYATIFIVEATKFTLGGKEHKHLIRLLKEFAEFAIDINNGGTG